MAPILFPLLLMLTGCADRLILYPSTGPIDAPGAQAHYIPFEGGKLEVYCARSPGVKAGGEPEAYVLSFVGNAARAEAVAGWEAMLWKEKPVEVWAVNYPGYGKSTGPASLGRLAPAGLAAYDALAAHGNGRRIFVRGESLGTTVALRVAAQRDVAGLVLRAPVPLRSLILGHFGWWNLWLGAGVVAMGVPDQLDSLANAARCQAPAAFVLIETDEIVPVSYQRMVLGAYRGRTRIIEHAAADHNGALTAAAARELDAAVDWMWNTPASARP
jgi:uncharacterized protein